MNNLIIFPHCLSVTIILSFLVTLITFPTKSLFSPIVKTPKEDMESPFITSLARLFQTNRWIHKLSLLLTATISPIRESPKEQCLTTTQSPFIIDGRILEPAAFISV